MAIVANLLHAIDLVVYNRVVGTVLCGNVLSSRVVVLMPIYDPFYSGTNNGSY